MLESSELCLHVRILYNQSEAILLEATLLNISSDLTDWRANGKHSPKAPTNKKG